MSFKRWAFNILIGIDQLVNTIFMGHPDETISSRLGKKLKAGKSGWFARYVCGELDKVDPNHCTKSIETKVDYEWEG